MIYLDQKKFKKRLNQAFGAYLGRGFDFAVY